jgi:hypothetical protein
MSPQQRRYLLLEQGIGAGIFNFVLNAAIAWAIFRQMETVPLWGQQSIAGDTIGTAFMLPLLTTLIGSRVVRGHVRKGRVAALAWPEASFGRRLPRWLSARGALLGAACILIAGIPATRSLEAAGIGEMSLGGFIVFKAAFAAVLAVLVTPLIARAALADGSTAAAGR